jgi:hypothetical protein
LARQQAIYRINFLIFINRQAAGLARIGRRRAEALGYDYEGRLRGLVAKRGPHLWAEAR